ncbi:heme exporter protein CcmB [Methylocella silvestris BL2]|uniref:Heme exporter protein B n=1 Tax=Methylocella silvestris (strain DSM 15510 / CIP 108128 / LMG 27833 / NCIMB 13906 / BL2) TaxID=395965 RepID=B8ETP4_METSB|nr:heme exporter protein CcmB [Methylocella silvestris BL2]
MSAGAANPAADGEAARRSPLRALFMRELRISRRIGGGGSLGVVFFLMLVVLTPFAVGPDLALLGRIAPAMLWIAALLATLLGLDRLFQSDHDDGSLDLLLMSKAPLELIVLVKCLAHWLVTGLPLVAAAPFFGLMLAMPAGQLWSVTLSLMIGTPALTLIGAIGAALTVSLRRGGLLLPVLILPFCTPALIFGVAAAAAGAAVSPAPAAPPFLILAAISLLALVGAPIAAAAALRQMSE